MSTMGCNTVSSVVRYVTTYTATYYDILRHIYAAYCGENDAPSCLVLCGTGAGVDAALFLTVKAKFHYAS